MVFSTNGTEKLDMHMQKLNLDAGVISFTKINPIWNHKLDEV